MQIEVKGRTFRSPTRCGSTSSGGSTRSRKQVSELATLDLEVADENVPGDPVAAEAVLHLKGTQLRAKEVSKDAKHAINLVGGQHGAPGQAPSRQAARPARIALGGRGRAHGRRDASRKRPAACSSGPNRGALDR